MAYQLNQIKVDENEMADAEQQFKDALNLLNHRARRLWKFIILNAPGEIINKDTQLVKEAEILFWLQIQRIKKGLGHDEQGRPQTHQ